MGSAWASSPGNMKSSPSPSAPALVTHSQATWRQALVSTGEALLRPREADLCTLARGRAGLGQPPGEAYNLAWGPGVLRQRGPQGCSEIFQFLQTVWGGERGMREQGPASE